MTVNTKIIDMEHIFYNNWQSLLCILVIGVLAYTGLIILLRVSGKRTLTKMNAFDFVVTVALGSTLATVLLSKDVTLIDGIVAFCVLIFLQYMVIYLCALKDSAILLNLNLLCCFTRGSLLEKQCSQNVLPKMS